MRGRPAVTLPWGGGHLSNGSRRGRFCCLDRSSFCRNRRPPRLFRMKAFLRGGCSRRLPAGRGGKTQQASVCGTESRGPRCPCCHPAVPRVGERDAEEGHQVLGLSNPGPRAARWRGGRASGGHPEFAGRRLTLCGLGPGRAGLWAQTVRPWGREPLGGKSMAALGEEEEDGTEKECGKRGPRPGTPTPGPGKEAWGAPL